MNLLRKYVSDFQGADGASQLHPNLHKVVEVEMNQKDTFICFMAALQKKCGDLLVAAMLLIRVMDLMCQLVKKQHLSDGDDDQGIDGLGGSNNLPVD